MQIACPSCKKQLRVPETLAGKKVKCPGCATVFPAGEGAAEKVRPAPSAARPRPAPPPAREEEQPAPRRSRARDDERDDERERGATRSRRRQEDDIDVDSDEDADLEDRPRRRSARRREVDDDDDIAEEERLTRRSRRRDAEDDYEDEDEDEDEGEDEEYERERSSARKKGRRRGKTAAILFIVTGAVALLMCVLKIATDLSIFSSLPIAPQGPNVNQQAFKVGQYAGLIGCGLIEVLCAAFQFMAAASVRSRRGKGVIIAAIVLALFLAALWGLRVVVNALALGRAAGVPLFSGGLKTLVILLIAGGVAALVLCVVAAILGIVTLNSREMKQAFRRR